MLSRRAAGISDISHMGMVSVRGERAGEFLESMTVGDITGLKEGHMVRTLIMNETGGIKDQCLVTREAEED